ncbi:MAG: ribonuclease J [Candidatus Doudnabacteria bacterium RIFCSPHIGHO2_12_FULL_48_11]|uniref:Ribonuclease J n=1 Tax=Candidatus Doudnabacteria bacterium RIFCSPHIGHO2_01_FULL_46_24 TaxID=1817825 RepID=A0A1F5NT81_9BACT|nr:MAG: ribonuclease J [Candidatus Doudnabacteria bacterium RIFCSPHIGHO2_01_FULL_46_24]OGE94157.1 MAG: ribonuclease J [Candidatus Doudnabacteria bacterium RIFCSPHIGHO2_12_FULL_48_11]
MTLKVIPLGGIEEVGENMTVLEYGDDILVIDAGIGFPDETMPGIDYIIPNTKYLEDNKKKIRGMIITHGHLDHIGAIPYIMPKIGDPPIYTMKLTGEFIKKRLEEFHLLGRSTIHEVNKDDVLTLGNFRIRFFRLNHNIPDSVGLAINTPAGLLVYATDWKFDHTPVDGKPTEFGKLAQFGAEGVALLMSDSTNAEKPGYSMSEKTLGETIDRLLLEAKGRVIFATFSTLIGRVQQLLDAAHKSNRKVVITGRSLVNSVEICLSTNYLQLPAKGMIIKMDQAKRLPDNQVVILTTGSQGEEFSALARISRSEHKTIQIKKGDTAVVSASPIPGNERSISSTLSNLARLGAKVLYMKILDIHTSGHAYQEDLKLMVALTRPKNFMPIHGEYHMLVAHANLARDVGVPESNIFTLNNGQMLELSSAGVGVKEARIPTGYVFVDGLGVGDVGEVVLRDRQVMSQDGMFVVIMTIDKKTGKLTQQPDIISRGFIYMKGSEDLLKEVKHEVRKVVETKNKKPSEANWAYIRSEVRDQIGEFLYQRTERRPMILPVVIEV